MLGDKILQLGEALKFGVIFSKFSLKLLKIIEKFQKNSNFLRKFSFFASRVGEIRIAIYVLKFFSKHFPKKMERKNAPNLARNFYFFGKIRKIMHSANSFRNFLPILENSPTSGELRSLAPMIPPPKLFPRTEILAAPLNFKPIIVQLIELTFLI